MDPGFFTMLSSPSKKDSQLTHLSYFEEKAAALQYTPQNSSYSLNSMTTSQLYSNEGKLYANNIMTCDCNKFVNGFASKLENEKLWN